LHGHYSEDKSYLAKGKTSLPSSSLPSQLLLYLLWGGSTLLDGPEENVRRRAPPFFFFFFLLRLLGLRKGIEVFEPCEPINRFFTSPLFPLPPPPLGRTLSIHCRLKTSKYRRQCAPPFFLFSFSFSFSKSPHPEQPRKFVDDEALRVSWFTPPTHVLLSFFFSPPAIRRCRLVLRTKFAGIGKFGPSSFPLSLFKRPCASQDTVTELLSIVKLPE